MSDATRKTTLVPNEMEGLLFPSEDAATPYTGAFMIAGAVFDVSLTSATASKTGKDYYRVVGTERDGKATLGGALFMKPAGTSAAGNAKPSFTGDATVKPGDVTWDLACWDREGKESKKPFLSVKVSVPRPKQAA